MNDRLAQQQTLKSKSMTLTQTLLQKNDHIKLQLKYQNQNGFEFIQQAKADFLYSYPTLQKHILQL